jgi:hypothetical protein
MSDRCRHEAHVQRAAAENNWTEALRVHVGSCEDCAAAAAVAPFMNRFARTNERQHRLPDASVVWLKAQLLRGTVMAERVSRPLNILQVVAYVVVAGGWAALVTWKWAELQNWMLTFTPRYVVGGLAGTQTAISGPLMLAVVVLASMTVMLALHTILAEE